jgi:ClpP class serine protease
LFRAPVGDGGRARRRNGRCKNHEESVFDKVRRRYLKQLQEHTSRNVIAYYSGFLTKPRIEGVEIVEDDKNGFMLCIHELERGAGLDLLLHTPGGSVAATESIVAYLRVMFGNDIRAIVPQLDLNSEDGDRRLDKSTDRLFPKV